MTWKEITPVGRCERVGYFPTVKHGRGMWMVECRVKLAGGSEFYWKIKS